MHLSGNLKIIAAQSSHAGVKEQNEDCIGIRIPSEPLLTMKGLVSVIADGVSAAESGKEAAETCVRNFINDYFSTPESWSVKKSAHKVIIALNQWLFSQSSQLPDSRKGYVSTFSSLILKSHQAHIFHVGDTRIYRIRNNKMDCLTRDHATWIDEKTSYLARAMGMDNRLDVDYRNIEVEANDVFLLTTDGIHDVLPAEQIQSEINSALEIKADSQALSNTQTLSNTQALSNTFDQVVEKLVELSLAAGSKDNLSCQLLYIESLPQSDIEDEQVKLTELPFPPILEPDNKIDGYKILKEIHASNRSQLYLAEDLETHNKLVIKTPSFNFEDDISYIERFILEEWLGKRIDSPYVAKVIDSERPKTCLYTLLEYVPGITLEQWIKENPKPNLDEAIRLIDGISRGLRAFHRKDIYYNDLKPDNVIIDSNGVPKLIDFGSCTAKGVEEINVNFERDTLLGTVEYTAPEIRFGKAISFSSDLFSLAVLCYEMLTGTTPFDKQLDNLNDERKLNSLKYRPAMKFNPMVPQWIDGAIKTACSPHPKQRHEALSEFIHELKTPNANYLDSRQKPLIESNPLLFWQSVAAIQAIVIGLMVFFG